MIRKAVIPAAGLGTRVLPATKAMAKEMLPIVDKPAIQYIVEEAVNSGIEEILIITSRGKSCVEDHFDRSPDLERALESKGKIEIVESLKRISEMARITFVRQQEQKGLGHAIMHAKGFVGNEPFAVLYGDDVIISDIPCCSQIIDAYEKTGLGSVGMKEVPTELVCMYSSMKAENIGGNLFHIDDMIEKPKPEQIFTNYSILGRCVLPPEIFDILENTKPGAGGEIQLTDAMKHLAQTKGMTGVDFIGTRYDMGNKLGILKASIEVGLKHPETAEGLKEYLKDLAKTL